MDWIRAAVENLIPLSQEQNELKTALAEWHHTGKLYDYGMPVETCQLCKKERLRYHFEIVNSKTDHSLLVGSSCIERFDIAVYGDDGNPLEGKEKAKRLQNEIKALKRDKVVQGLRDLWQVSSQKNQGFVEDCATKIKKGKGLSPDTIQSLFNLLAQHAIQFDPQLFKVSLRSTWDKDQLLKMSEQDRHVVWNALTKNQRIAISKYKDDVEKAERKRQEELKRLEEQRQQREQRRLKETVQSGRLITPTRNDEAEWQRKRADLFRALQTSRTEPKEAECELCHRMVTEWYVYDNKTGTCKCRDCYRRLSKQT